MRDIEQAVCGWLADIDGLERALDHEPQRLPSYPMTTLLLSGMNPLQAETGMFPNDPGDDILYQWRLRLYVALTDYEKAQNTIKDLVPEIVKINREHPTGDGLCDFLQIQDDGGPPEFNEEDGWAAYDFVLRAQRTEVS